MANRYFTQFYYSFLKYPTSIYARVAIGASGAPTLSAANSKGVASIVRDSAGTYTITLQDVYGQLLGVSNSTFLASGVPSHVEDPYIKADAVSTSKSLQVVFVDYAGAAVDPSNGEQLRLEIKLNNSTS